MSGNFSDFQANAWLTKMKTDGCWVALHFDSPVTGGAYASEYSGGGYARIAGSWTTPSGRAMWNSGIITFTGLVAGTVTYVGGWNAATLGDLVWWTQLPVPKAVGSGGQFQILPNDIALSL